MTENETREKSGPFGGAACRHVKLDGTPCAQPALRLKEYCRFHHILYQPAILPGQALFRPPILEDSASLQVVIMQVIRELMRQPIDKRSAGLILYGLQLASANLARACELYPPQASRQELCPPSPPQEEGTKKSGESLAELLLRTLREEPEQAASEPPGFEAPIPAPLTGGGE